MRIRLFAATAAVVVAAAFVAVPAFTEEEPSEQPPAMDPAAMEWWQKTATPGENHRWMDFVEGKWNAENKYWMGPGEPQVSKGTFEAKWVFDKHYMRGVYKSDVMGMPFSGEHTMAYSNATQEYQQSWVDNMGTHMHSSKGKREGDVVTFTGKVPSYMGMLPERSVLTKISDDRWIFETWWDMPDMGEFKIMEIVYTRAE